MIYPLPEESLLSYIYRINLVESHLTKLRVVSTSGKWKKRIALTAGFQKYFAQLTDFQLSKLICDSGYIGVELNQIDTIIEINTTLRNILKGEKIKLISSLPIKYCKKCISNFIEKYGVGYIKAEWNLSTGPTICTVHDELYFQIDVENAEQAEVALRKIISGRSSEYCVKLNNKPLKFHYDLNEKIQRSLESFPYLAPCLSNKLKGWLLTQGRKTPNEIHSVIGTSDKACYVKAGCRRIQTSEIEKYVFKSVLFRTAYRRLYFSDYPEFTRFWEENRTEKTIYFGVIKQQDLQASIHKLRSRNCSKCNEWECPAVELIFEETQPRLFRKRHFICHKDISSV